MKKSKIYKISGVLFLLVLMSAFGYYTQLPTRHKAIIKTTLLQKTGMMKSEWEVLNGIETYKMISPDFYIDGIYKSMEGPKSSNFMQLSQDTTLLWLTGFHVKARDTKTNTSLSNDFICHTNVDFNDVKYYSNFNLDNRIGKQYPRLTSLSHGLENFNFPTGYGVPMKGNDLLYITTQSLNHNNPKESRFINHEVAINFSRKKDLKPLMSKTVFVQLPYDKYDPFKSPVDPGKDFCIPVETKNHSYDDGKGNKLSGHWVIPNGKNRYESYINNQLQLQDSLRLHAAAVHVHPFATALTLYDQTDRKTIFKSNVINHKNSIGLNSIEAFASSEGVWLYKNHSYKLIIEVNNTSAISQDMMGSMFLFFYDKELEESIKKGILK
jgi:hypothetical protein